MPLLLTMLAIAAPHASQAQEPATNKEFRVDSDASWLRVLAYPDGPLRRFGHHHVISHHGISGIVVVAPNPLESTILLELTVADLEVDDPALRANLMELYLTLEAYPDVAPCLETLRSAGRSTAILSNGTPDMLQAAVSSAGLSELFDAVLSVEAVGIYKPDARVYQLAVDRLNLAPARICFVSTNGWDAAGASFFGLRVAWMNRFAQRPERLPDAPAAVIGALDELPGLLGL